MDGPPTFVRGLPSANQPACSGPHTSASADGSNNSVVSAYEKRIAKLEREKILEQEQLAKSGKPRHTFEESFEHAMQFLANPWTIWENADLLMKKTVLRLAFVEPLPYCRKEGLRTPNLALPFKALGWFCSNRCEVVHPKGFEPLAP
jgi:site-specific DNA recombinase